MYGIFTYIYYKNQPNVGKYTSPTDPLGYDPTRDRTSQYCHWKNPHGLDISYPRWGFHGDSEKTCTPRMNSHRIHETKVYLSNNLSLKSQPGVYIYTYIFIDKYTTIPWLYCDYNETIIPSIPHTVDPMELECWVVKLQNKQSNPELRCTLIP